MQPGDRAPGRANPSPHRTSSRVSPRGSSRIPAEHTDRRRGTAPRPLRPLLDRYADVVQFNAISRRPWNFSIHFIPGSCSGRTAELQHCALRGAGDPAALAQSVVLTAVTANSQFLAQKYSNAAPLAPPPGCSARNDPSLPAPASKIRLIHVVVANTCGYGPGQARS